jgi:C-terminal processing protease CtpA/Prc
VPATLRRSSVLNVADGSFFPILTLSARAAGDTVTVECNTTKVPLSRRAGSQVTANRRLPSYEYRPVGDVGWITLRRFAGNDADLTLLGKLKDDYPRHSQHPVLVFDMRGNPGGNDSYVHRWVLQATNRTYFGGAGMTLVGPYTGCIQWNNMVIDQVAAGRADSDQAKADRQQTTKSWPEKVAPTHVQTKEYVFTGESKASYTGKVVILLDAMSFSSAETAADELVRALGAKVVGERSGGTLEYGNIVRVLLPNTGARMVMTTRQFVRERPMEGIGLPVDLYLSDADASPETLAPLLAKWAK